MAVASPFEILDLRPGGELVTRVLAFEEGPMPVSPRDGRASRVVAGVRLHVPAEDKLTEPRYWDVTAQTLRPSLLATLPQAVAGRRWLRVHKFGSGAAARFSLELLPPDFNGPARADVAQMTG